jgi:pimeloyl-ACP methyl ester carboxylesterase
MRRLLLTAVPMLILLLGCPVLAFGQQIPFLNELQSRSGRLARLSAERSSLSSEVRARVESLRKRAEEAFKSGDIPAILEAQGEALAVLEGKGWDERQKFLSSLALETNKLIIEPNTELRVSLARMFPADESKAFDKPPTVTFSIMEGEPATKSPTANIGIPKLSKPLVIAERVAIGETSSNAGRRMFLSDGAYWVVARVESDSQVLVEIKRAVYAIADFSDSVTQLSAAIAGLRKATAPPTKSIVGLVATPEFQLQRLASLNKGRGDREINPFQEFDRIETELSQLSRGANPFLNERGEIERAYRASDGAVIPYRIYVPHTYDGASPRPLVVMLHGALGDERYYFSGMFDPGAIKNEAERRGWILVGVNGRAGTGAYRGLGLTDPLEVIETIKSEYRIDGSRIYLTGHSMGAYATWLVAAAKPEVFAAMAPVAGGAPAQGDQLAALLDRVRQLPALVVHGARDGIVPPESSRGIAAAAGKAGQKVTVVETPNDDHFTIVSNTFPAVLDFFEKNSKASPER